MHGPGRLRFTKAERAFCIYPNLKLRMYTTGMRQNRLAKLVGIDEANLSRIINGIQVPKQKMREDIAAVLGCNAEWLFERTFNEAGGTETTKRTGRSLLHQQ